MGPLVKQRLLNGIIMFAKTENNITCRDSIVYTAKLQSTNHTHTYSTNFMSNISVPRPQLDNDKRNGILNVENENSAYRHIDENTLCLYLYVSSLKLPVI